MSIYDKSCMFEQAISDLDIATDQRQNKIKEIKVSGQTPETPSTDNDAINSILINNNANAIK